jgi:hypothetical protein
MELRRNLPVDHQYVLDEVAELLKAERAPEVSV